jgi:hypothetical protein
MNERDVIERLGPPDVIVGRKDRMLSRPRDFTYAAKSQKWFRG